MEEQDLEVYFGEEVSHSNEVLYELNIKRNSDSKMIFMVNDKSCPTILPILELDNITLGDVVYKETVFSLENTKKN